MTPGLILHESTAGVLTTDGQFHGPWNTEVAWGLENDTAGLWGAVTSAEEGEVSKAVLVGSEGMMGKVDDDRECPFIH